MTKNARLTLIAIGVIVAIVAVYFIVSAPGEDRIDLVFSDATCTLQQKPADTETERGRKLRWSIVNQCPKAVRVCMAKWRRTPEGDSSDDEGPAEDTDSHEAQYKVKHCTNVTANGGRDTIKAKVKTDPKVLGKHYYNVMRAVEGGTMEKIDPMIDIVR
jgi:hypothetical protein